MTTEHPIAKSLLIVTFSASIGGCGNSDSAVDTTSATGGAQAASSAVTRGGTSSNNASTTRPSTGGQAQTGGASQTLTGGQSNATQPVTGGTSARSSSNASGGSPRSSGSLATGGATTGGATGVSVSGGTTGIRTDQGGRAGRSSVGSRAGNATTGGASGGAASGGAKQTSAVAGSGATPTTSTGSGTCTASKSANVTATGSGPHKVTVETNADPGIVEGTIYRPTDLGGSEKYPIFVWGEGGCSLDGSSNSAAMAEIASHGYFVIADGTPKNSASRSMDSSNPAAMGKPLLAYVTWAIAENDKPCSAYHNSLDTTKIASNGFSCGGLMAEGTAGDPRITTWGLNSSGLFAANQAFYKTIHTPVLIVLGGPSDMAYENGKRDYDNISALGVPIMYFSKDLGHGGDLFSRNGGDFTKIDLAWLNWWLKGDETATGKGRLVGSSCTYCSDSAWEVKSKNLP